MNTEKGNIKYFLSYYLKIGTKQNLAKTDKGFYNKIKVIVGYYRFLKF